MHQVDICFTDAKSGNYVLDPERQMKMKYKYPIMNLDAVKIMQCTGLKDADGTYIYQGDILKCKEEYMKDHIMSISFEYGGFWNMYESCLPEFFKIIGNVFENPELLKNA